VIKNAFFDNEQSNIFQAFRTGNFLDHPVLRSLLTAVNLALRNI